MQIFLATNQSEKAKTPVGGTPEATAGITNLVTDLNKQVRQLLERTSRYEDTRS